ncbi:type I restriction enzyme, S subunit [Prosthecobacter debontii]|uniref:Type I restriction enzyme, S subunit n=1 Tax=Prosthecobacter debontii TaxID=48467 RepID=A0A1T4XKZ9_9BACT|nr:restriction endonuclease subunit S [Prosthecobacter debontii]SKA90269.1 type I restriction enzyme, S subunit [Prosthecobacter debontii]
MTATHPSPAKLKPNPAWASLSLFERTGWKRMAFGEFAENIGERAEPKDAQEEIYVGLEHLDPQCLHIRRWGKGSDVTGTKLRFRKGDIIFGRRRAYQRKLAVAEFCGICSAHAMVIRARPDKVLPEFLPFLMMSDRFMNRAVEISVGSLSPTINWTTLKLETFDLPPLDQQRRIAEILWAVDENEQQAITLRSALENAKAATVHAFIEQAREHGQITSLLKGCQRVTDGTHQPPGVTDEGVPFFLVKTISSGWVDWSHIKFVSEETYMELTRRVRPKHGDILYTAVGATYGVALLVDFDTPFVFQRHIAHIIPNPDVFDSEYLALFLNSPFGKRQSDRAATGSVQPTVTLKSLSSFKVPCPPVEKQRDLATKAKSFDSALKARALADLRAISSGILNSILP